MKKLTHLLWIAPLAVWAESALRPMAEPDLFFYFALVQKYLQTGAWPINDPFVYTLPGDSLMTLHQWLGYWIYFLPFQWFGWAGPILLKAGLVVLFFSIPLWPWRKVDRPIPFYFPFLWAVAVFTAHHRFRERVSLFGDLFLLLLVSGLLWWRDKKWFWYSLPAMFLAWAQLHPSWPLGWFILGTSFLLRPLQTWERHQIVCSLLCLVAPIFNPLWLDGLLYPFRFAWDVEPYLRQYVVEWLPLTDSRLFGYRFLYLPFITFIPGLAVVLWRQRAPLFEWFLWLIATLLTVKSVRFGLVAEGIFLVLVSQAAMRAPAPQPRKWLVVATTLLALGIAIMKVSLSPRLNITLAQRFNIDTGYFPESAAEDVLRWNPQLRIFNSFGYGGYLSWKWMGNPAIFFHGFSTNFKFYEDYYNGPQESFENFNNMVRKFDIGMFLLSKLGNDDNFIRILEQHGGWQKVREDGASVIFAKKDPRLLK